MSAGPREQAVAYLLEELDAPARAAFEARLAKVARLRAEVDGLRPVVGRLDRMDTATWEAPEPPAAPRIPRAPAPPARTARRRSLPAWGVALAACAVLAVAVALVGTGLGGADGRTVALAPVDGATRGTGQVRLEGDEAVVRVEDLPATAEGDFYELWLLTAPTRLVSLGSFRVDGSGGAELRLPVPVDPEAFRYLDVSLEPGDGDPAHSQRSVLRAPTSS